MAHVTSEKFDRYRERWDRWRNEFAEGLSEVRVQIRWIVYELGDLRRVLDDPGLHGDGSRAPTGVGPAPGASDRCPLCGVRRGDSGAGVQPPAAARDTEQPPASEARLNRSSAETIDAIREIMMSPVLTNVQRCVQIDRELRARAPAGHDFAPEKTDE